MEKQQPIDLFHPFSSLEWQQCGSLPEGVPSPICVALHGRLYIGGGGLKPSNRIAFIFVSSPDLTSWTEEATPIGWYGLATFRSQLVLVGGKKGKLMRSPQECLALKSSNELWVSGDCGKNWKQTLPPMRAKRAFPLAVNPGTPECLIVAGGERQTSPSMPSLVEVFVNGQWLQVVTTPALSAASGLVATLHAGNLFVRCDIPNYRPPFLYCSVKQLIASATPPTTPAKKFTLKEFYLPQMGAIPISYGQGLLSLGGISGPTTVLIFSLDSQSWVETDDMPVNVWKSGSVVLPTGELVVLEGFSAKTSTTVFKAKPKVSFDYEGVFPTSCMCKLEEKGFPVKTALLQSSDQELEASFKELPNTWKALVDLFEAIKHKELSLKIKDYLHVPGGGIKLLGQMCMEVIMSALLEQRSLELNHLQSLLPDYVPPSFKTAIRNKFKLLTDPSSVLSHKK